MTIDVGFDKNMSYIVGNNLQKRVVQQGEIRQKCLPSSVVRVEPGL